MELTMSERKVALVTGGTGQDSSYLMEILLDKGYFVVGCKRRSSSINTSRIDHLYHHPNLRLEWLEMSDVSAMYRLLLKHRPDEIYNLAAQSHVQVSFALQESTVDSVAMGFLRLLNAARDIVPSARVYQASSSEMFGDNPDVPFNEESVLMPASPYACAKCFCHQLARNYRKSYGMFIASGILFNHECFYYDTPVILKRGDSIDVCYVGSLIPSRKNITKDSLLETKDYAGHGVKIWDGNKFADVLTISRRTLSTLASENRIKITTNTSHGVVDTTPNHSLILAEGKKSSAASCCSNVDKLLHGTYPALTSNNKILSEEASEFLGLLCSDGHVSNHLRLTNSCPIIQGRFLELARTLFCFADYRKSEYVSGFGGRTTNIDLKGVSSSVVSWIRELLYDHRTGHKKVPSEVLNASVEVKQAFFRGYYAGDGQKAGSKSCYEYKSFTTNSPLLAQGLLLLCSEIIPNQDFCISSFYQKAKKYTRVNFNSPNCHGGSGAHLKKDRDLINRVLRSEVENQHVFDVETSTGKINAGVGTMVVANSPRRGETFVSRKITLGAARIAHGLEEKLYLGNLDAKRDWGYAKEYMEVAWKMLQQDQPDDFVIATGTSHSVREFAEKTFTYAGLGDYKKYVEVDARYLRPHEVPFLLGDSSKAQRDLGWTPKVRIDELIELMYTDDYDVVAAEKHVGAAKWKTFKRRGK
jgi:GDPmannose 4,6-dehydratase